MNELNDFILEDDNPESAEENSENEYNINEAVSEEDLKSFEGIHGTLYDPIHAPDNYDHSTLFSGLKLNPYPLEWTVWTVIMTSGRYIVSFCAVCTFHAIHYHTVTRLILPSTILTVCTYITILFYLFGTAFKTISNCEKLRFTPDHAKKEHIRLCAIFIIFSYQMAPLLRSLTVSISLNTLQYIGGITSILYLCTAFYGIESFMTSTTISVNSAIIGTICLSSRLHSDYDCFVMMILTSVVFILFPVFAKLFWNQLWILIFSIIIGSIAAYSVSIFTLCLFLGVVFLGLGVAPVLIVYGLKYKHNIYGPWDEAIIEPYVRPSRIIPQDIYR